MLRVVLSTVIALTFFSSVAAAQQPCTTDANRVVSELYRHILQRAPDAGAQNWSQQLASGRMTVRELVRTLAKSPEHEQNFGQGEAGESTRYERAVARYYRHILGRQPDQEGQRAHAEGAQREGLDSVVDSLVNSQEYTNNFGDWGVPGSGGVTFCATNASANNAPAPQPRAQVTEPRFRGMDRNRDGQITRAEWNGSTQSFRVHDWNGNGVLDGEEVRQGSFRQGRTLEDEDFDRADTFENLDFNNNNRIEQGEWHASLQAFDRLDNNRDGVLSRAELGVNQANNRGRGGARRANDYNFDALDVNNNNRIERREWVARGDVFNQLDVDRNNVLSRAEVEQAAANTNPRAGVGTTGDYLVVDSSVRWTDTGINVREGQMITFDADGEVRLSDNRGDFASPAGSQTNRRAASSPIPNAPAGGLIARIGNGNPAYVGDRRALRAPITGRLYLSVNDDYLADNEGDYRVRITVR